MAWEKGQTGNRNGRPPARRVEALRIYAEPKAKAAIDKLAAIAEREVPDDPKWAEVIAKACIALLDRVGMVPPKPREETEEAAPEPEASRDMTPEELERIAAGGES